MNRGGNWRSLGCAALVGAAVAFPAGMMFAGRDAVERESRAGPGGPAARPARSSRNLYSPNVVSDPYVLDQQRRIVEMLELNCRQFRENCAEAKQAREAIEEAAAD